MFVCQLNEKVKLFASTLVTLALTIILKKSFQCVFEELLLATKKTADTLEINLFSDVMETLVAFHLAYHRVESIFYNFARIIDISPDIMNTEIDSRDREDRLTVAQDDMVSCDIQDKSCWNTQNSF